MIVPHNLKEICNGYRLPIRGEKLLIRTERMFLIYNALAKGFLGSGYRVNFGSQFVRGWGVLGFVDVGASFEWVGTEGTPV